MTATPNHHQAHREPTSLLLSGALGVTNREQAAPRAAPSIAQMLFPQHRADDLSMYKRFFFASTLIFFIAATGCQRDTDAPGASQGSPHHHGSSGPKHGGFSRLKTFYECLGLDIPTSGEAPWPWAEAVLVQLYAQPMRMFIGLEHCSEPLEEAGLDLSLWKKDFDPESSGLSQWNTRLRAVQRLCEAIAEDNDRRRSALGKAHPGLKLPPPLDCAVEVDAPTFLMLPEALSREAGGQLTTRAVKKLDAGVEVLLQRVPSSESKNPLPTFGQGPLDTDFISARTPDGESWSLLPLPQLTLALSWRDAVATFFSCEEQWVEVPGQDTRAVESRCVQYTHDHRCPGPGCDQAGATTVIHPLDAWRKKSLEPLDAREVIDLWSRYAVARDAEGALVLVGGPTEEAESHEHTLWGPSGELKIWSEVVGDDLLVLGLDKASGQLHTLRLRGEEPPATTASTVALPPGFEVPDAAPRLCEHGQALWLLWGGEWLLQSPDRGEHWRTITRFDTKQKFYASPEKNPGLACGQDFVLIAGQIEAAFHRIGWSRCDMAGACTATAPLADRRFEQMFIGGGGESLHVIAVTAEASGAYFHLTSTGAAPARWFPFLSPEAQSTPLPVLRWRGQWFIADSY